MAFAPQAKDFKSPFNLAKAIEKEVIKTSLGTISETVLKAWESVTTSFGGTFSISKDFFNSLSFTTRHTAFLSRTSLIVCT